MELCNTSTHLSYCTNIHAGASWAEAFAALQENVPTVRDACRTHTQSKPFGIGLRLSMSHLEALEVEATFQSFMGWLAEQDLYVFTINGFPYGAFHGEPVKAEVYRPDWTQPERLDYTCRLANLATRMATHVKHISISTLPGTFKAWAAGAESAIADQLLQCVAHCQRVEQEGGIYVAIALEPEPCCMLETADEVIRFFAEWLQSESACQQLALNCDISTDDARTAIARHLGVCHDVCHSAVEYEPALEAVTRYADAGIGVFKIQLSSALRLDPASEDARAALSAFDEPVYLHQVVRRNSGDDLQRYSDISKALDAETDLTAEWRVHFHVPVFLDAMEVFGTTQSVLAELLDAQANQAISPHLEVETYTWDVLPARYRDVPIADAIARELDWVRTRLESSHPTRAEWT